MKNSLRISGGNLRGKKIPFEFKDSLRPTSSKLKEILFNWIQFEIHECVCLDLFAGTGSLGIEALSRGSPKVIFVELNKKNYSSLSINLKILGIRDRCKIFFKDAFSWLKNYDLSDIDIIFLDPPFKEIKLNNLIDQIKNRDLLNKNGIIITHRHKRDNLDLSNKLNIIDERSYGISKIIIGI